MPLTKTPPASQVADEAVLLVRVAGPGVGAEPERRVVGELDRLVRSADAVERGDRAEGLLVVHAHLGGDVGERRSARRTSRRSVRRALSAAQHGGALVRRASSTSSSRSARPCSLASGPTSVSSSIGSPTVSAAMPAGEPLGEGVVDVGVHDEPLGRDAGLAVVLARGR